MKKTKSTPTNRIAEVRRMMGLTQSDLADRVEVHWITISKLERGQIKLSAEWLTRLADALSVPEDMFLPEDRALTTLKIRSQINAGGVITHDNDDEVSINNSFFNAFNRFWCSVKGDALAPVFQDGDILCFERNPELDPMKFLNRFSMIFTLVDGETEYRSIFGYPHLTSTGDLYTVVVPNGPPIQEVRIDIFAPLVMTIYNHPHLTDTTETSD